MRGDPLRHFIVEGFSGRHIDAPRIGGGAAFRVAALARPRAAEDQRRVGRRGQKNAPDVAKNMNAAAATTPIAAIAPGADAPPELEDKAFRPFRKRILRRILSSQV